MSAILIAALAPTRTDLGNLMFFLILLFGVAGFLGVAAAVTGVLWDRYIAKSLTEPPKIVQIEARRRVNG